MRIRTTFTMPAAGNLRGCLRLASVAAILLMLGAGCSSQPKYPKQVITVLPPPPEGPAAPQYPTGPSYYPGVTPEHPGQVPAQIPGAVYPNLPPTPPSQVPGETRPQVPGEVGAPPNPAPVPPPGMAGQSHYNQGVLLFRQGNVDGAMQQFRMAVAENPRDVRARNNLGVLLEKSGDSHGAIEQYKAALKAEPNNKVTHRLLARALAQSGDIDGAIDQYEYTVKLDPTDPGVHN